MLGRQKEGQGSNIAGIRTSLVHEVADKRM